MTLRGERGSVTAELVVALPAVALVLALCLGAVRLGMQATGAQDAAAAAARTLARGESTSAAASRAAAVAPGAHITVSHRDGLVCVSVTLSGGVPALRLPVSASACALEGPA